MPAGDVGGEPVERADRPGGDGVGSSANQESRPGAGVGVGVGGGRGRSAGPRSLLSRSARRDQARRGEHAAGVAPDRRSRLRRLRITDPPPKAIDDLTLIPRPAAMTVALSTIEMPEHASAPLTAANPGR
jgi:hypothetical protein